MATQLENFSKVENVNQDAPEWVKQKIKSELDALKVEPFYKIEENNWEKRVDYNMDTVKSYLESLKWLSIGKIREKWSAWVMAVQIALESQGYDVWKIDWMLGNRTKAAVRLFQEKEGIKVDWDPGPETIWKLLENLGWLVSEQEEWEDKEWKKEWEDKEWKKEWEDKEWKREWEDKEWKKEWEDKEWEKEWEGKEWENKEPFSKEKFNVFIEATRPILSKLWLSYVSTWGWIKTNNPKFDVMEYNDGRYVTKTFNFRDFVEGNKFLVEKLENTLKTEMDKAVQEDKMERDEYINAYNFVGKIRGKKYSLKDLNLENNNQGLDLLTLLNEFPSQKVRIDWHSGCTFYDANTKKFHIELNRKSFNNKDWCVREVSREEFKNNEWNYSEDVFKQKLTQRIQDIAKEYFSE